MRKQTPGPIVLDWDEDGLHISIDTAELRHVVLEMDGGTMRGVLDTGQAWDLYEHVQDQLGEWYAEGAAMRTRVKLCQDALGRELARDGYDLTDPKHPDYHDNAASIWDEREGK